MLTPKPQLNLQNAKGYFREHLAVGDYYMDGNLVLGQWRGTGAALRGFPQDKTLHLILDNHGARGHPRVRRWLQRHPRFVPHFIPTSSSWLNLIERWFAELEQKAVRRAALRNVPELQRAIVDFMGA